MSEADTVILAGGNDNVESNEDGDNGDEGSLAEASLAEASSPLEITIKEVCSLSVSAPNIPIITIN